MTWDEPSTTIILGPSGSGKTTLAVALSAKLGLPVYVVNSSAKPYQRGRRVEWEQLPLRKKRITYVIEDLTNLTEANKARVLELLNVASRHQVRFFFPPPAPPPPLKGVALQESHVFILMHGVRANNAYSIYSYITRIVFTPSLLNVSAFRELTRKYFGAKTSERDLDVLKRARVGEYTVLDVAAGEVYAAGLDMEPLDRSSGSERRILDEAAIQSYIQCSANPKACLALLKYLEAVYPLHDVVDEHFAISLAAGKEKLSFNLIDYLHQATSDAKPSRAVALFQRHLFEEWKFPMALITNPRLK